MRRIYIINQTKLYLRKKILIYHKIITISPFSNCQPVEDGVLIKIFYLKSDKIINLGLVRFNLYIEVIKIKYFI